MDSLVVRFAILLVLSLSSGPAHAHDSDADYGYQSEDYLSTRPYFFIPENFADPGRRVHKFELALKTLNIPLEAQPDFTQFPNAGEASEEAFLDTLRFIDPEGGLKRYLDLQTDQIDLFRDFFDHLLPKDFLEYGVTVREEGSSNDSQPLMNRLKEIAAQASQPGNPLPLENVRIIIDPGHMGNELWDDYTGKYVEIRGKKKQLVGRVSEGQLTLWTALLTANALEKLGAIVQVTRTDLAPVSKQDYRNYDHSAYLNQYFYDGLDGWMAKYLHLGDLELTKKIKTAPEVKKVFPTTSAEIQALRTSFFISAEDLEARARLIRDFHPDLTLDIHFDASKSNALQNKTNDVEGYVPGQFAASETGSRSMRAHAFRHALEARRWAESVNFTSTVTAAVSNQLKIPQLDVPAMAINDKVVAVKVKNGVYARNLYITRRSTEGLIAYLECLHYDHTSEFYNLAKKDKSGTYQGLTFKYPSRLQKVADGIRDGVMNYFQALPENPGELQLELEQLDTRELDIKKKISGTPQKTARVNVRN